MDIIRIIANKYNVRVSENSVEELASILERREYKKDEIILEQGIISRYLYIIEKGIIRQFYYKDGRDITEHFSSEGNVATCLESLFLKEPTKLLVEALEPSVIYLLDYEKWKAICNRNPEINELYQRIFEYKLIVSQQKADSWRFESAHERYERFCKEYPIIAKRAAIAHIASYLLMTPETLSRVRSAAL
ncbi:Crp/Fnr family transcriptional regulator [Dysgonomonas sp. 216]|uniref:Crp/Fnr family transcriptional regulator n=1 Tax=Dysgonomonas sp. 216 TaxID=2302934 RepID=UPI0013D7DAD5|nr:Crp/Fnr family transcriptional regulator [Dysgonomonas sp. 216]NDW19388.1 Crp/Fnr family transcriptional regulator [Dysgonomonas sp. 216]